MSILERNKSLFPMVIRERGHQYFLAGRVEIVYADDTDVMAEVEGSDIYHVEVQWDGLHLLAACSCPYAEENFCKHIYAVLCRIDRDDILPGIERIANVRLKLVSTDDIYADEDDLDFHQNPKFLKGQRPAPGESWTNRLDDIRSACIMRQTPPAAKPIDAGEMVYVIRPSRGYHLSAEPDDLSLNIHRRMRKKNGQFGQMKPFNASREKLQTLDADDAKILSILTGAQSLYDYSRPAWGNSTFILTRTLAEVLLPVVEATGRLFFEDNRSETLHGPLTWRPDEIWIPTLTVTPDASTETYACTLEFIHQDEKMPLTRPIFLTRQGVMLVDLRLCRYDDSVALPWIEYLRKQKSISVPKGQIQAFVQKLYAMPSLPALSLPPELQRQEVAAPARPGLILRTQEAHYYLQDKKKFRATLYFTYEGCQVAALPAARGFYVEAKNYYLLRDDNAENIAWQKLVDLGFKTAKDQDDSATHEISAAAFARVVAALTAEGWSVEADGQLYREAGAFSLNVTTGIDWFELSGECMFENQKAKLPALLAALSRKENIVQLSDGTFGILPQEALNQFAFLARMGEVHDGHFRFKKSQAGLLDALLASQPQATCDALFENTRRQLQNFCGIEPGAAPASFQGTLRRYQEEALGWFDFLERFGFGGCLADDMGLGKTVQVLALLEKRRLLGLYETQHAHPSDVADVSDAARDAGHRPSLVVAPRSVLFNWRKEAARFTPNLRVLEHTGLDRQPSAENFVRFDLVLTTYGTLRRDAAAFRAIDFDYAILDEAQAIKNADTASAKAVRLLRARHRLALSGTPIENHLSDLWSLFEFLNPGLLGTASVFKRMSADTKTASPETRGILSQALKPFILRRTKALVAPELPQKTEQVIYCEMDKVQARLYNELRDHYRRSLIERLDQEGIGKSRMHILEALLRLRQAACHPGLLDEKLRAGASAKTEFLLPQLSEILEEGHKALIFSQFTSFLSIVKKQLDDAGQTYLYLDGRTKNREALVRAFQEDAAAPLFLISLRAGGLGLNLTAAEYVYLLDPWWNPAVEAQAIDRTHRIGQTEQVFAYRLITRNTVEERVLELQQSKRDLFTALISEDAGLLRDLKREDLEILLS